MIQTDYVRNLHCNYARVLLEEEPKEKRYQYVIVQKGGIRGLLECGMQAVEGKYYLYYDISSKQNIKNYFGKDKIDRAKMRKFIFSLKALRVELERFLLDESNISYDPNNIYADMDNDEIQFMFIPYVNGEDSFENLLEYFIDNLNYEDEKLVEFVYLMYDSYTEKGFEYIGNDLYKDAAILEETIEDDGFKVDPEMKLRITAEKKSEILPIEKEERKPVFKLFDKKQKRQDRKAREDYENEMMNAMQYSVAEEAFYTKDQEEKPMDPEKTFFIEGIKEIPRKKRRLYYKDETVAFTLEDSVTVIGKKKGGVDCLLEDRSISRLHAKIYLNGDSAELEDLNSTNGTYKNGIQLTSYERISLEEGDEIRLGDTLLIYK